MGFFSKSLLILLVGLSTPLVYRQFANDSTIKFMSSYYSNYKSIDQFLRQSAGHLDKAKDYIPDSKQFKEAISSLNGHFETILSSAKSLKSNFEGAKQEEKVVAKDNDVKEKKQKVERKDEAKFRVSHCPGEDLGGQQIRLWDKQELSKFDGNSGQADVYLGFLGLVYNVTMNQQHYAAGAEYNVFAGRDATRAFVTGNFTHDLNDDISDIDETLYSHIESWESFYKSSYPVLGRIIGKFFDSQGCGTQELGRVFEMFNKLEQEKQENREQEKFFPECNSEWNSDLNKGRVWCSVKSGGIERDWIGSPRMFQNQKCVCVNLESQEAQEYANDLQFYPGCNPSATECPINSPGQ